MLSRSVIALMVAGLVIAWCESSKASMLDGWHPQPVEEIDCG